MNPSVTKGIFFPVIEEPYHFIELVNALRALFPKLLCREDKLPAYTAILGSTFETKNEVFRIIQVGHHVAMRILLSEVCFPHEIQFTQNE